MASLRWRSLSASRAHAMRPSGEPNLSDPSEVSMLPGSAGILPASTSLDLARVIPHVVLLIVLKGTKKRRWARSYDFTHLRRTFRN
jgi:hypothetical protein